MTGDKKVEWQVRIIGGVMMLGGIGLFAAFVLWGGRLLKAIANRVFTADVWSEAYWMVLLTLVIWVIWQNYITRLSRAEWAKVLDNQYNFLKDDLRDLAGKVEQLDNRLFTSPPIDRELRDLSAAVDRIENTLTRLTHTPRDPYEGITM